MIQSALNGEYGPEDHPDVPVTLEQLVADSAACYAAGAMSVHLHPRRASDGVESLAPETHDAVVAAVRAAVPNLEICFSTQKDIDLGLGEPSAQIGQEPPRSAQNRDPLVDRPSQPHGLVVVLLDHSPSSMAPANHFQISRRTRLSAIRCSWRGGDVAGST
jgi:hypothetical protein